jgi:hypothetical protein
MGSIWVDGPDIYSVILLMGAEPFDLNHFVFKNHPHHKTVPVSHDIENDPIIAY